MDISCKKTNCIYNESNHCTARAITVGSDLDCKTFARDSSKLMPASYSLNKSLFEIGEIEKHFTEHEQIDVGCKAKSCVFNKEGVCSANGISVLSSRKSAFCATSIKK
ncbi:MAG: hypothetical protein CVV59_00040 [Tenericutes bacterium HGW-Tenericutes-4]|nr:MAG: hypothetical protein CVV59_00040 [Tenericutes bacterium HGW-Tenericutes-4]